MRKNEKCVDNIANIIVVLHNLDFIIDGSTRHIFEALINYWSRD